MRANSLRQFWLTLLLAMASGLSTAGFLDDIDESRRAIIKLRQDLDGLRQKTQSDQEAGRQRIEKSIQDLAQDLKLMRDRLTGLGASVAANDRALESTAISLEESTKNLLKVSDVLRANLEGLRSSTEARHLQSQQLLEDQSARITQNLIELDSQIQKSRDEMAKLREANQLLLRQMSDDQIRQKNQMQQLDQAQIKALEDQRNALNKRFQGLLDEQIQISEKRLQSALAERVQTSEKRHQALLEERVQALDKIARELSEQSQASEKRLQVIEDSARATEKRLQAMLVDQATALEAKAKASEVRAAEPEKPLPAPDTVRVLFEGREFAAELLEKRDFELAMVLIRKSDFAAAQKAFFDFLTRYPKSGYAPSGLFWLGNAQYQTRDYKEAILNFRQMISAAPDHLRAPEAALSVANCQAELKDTRGARKTLDDLIKAYPASEAASAAKDRLKLLK
jgi:tol-pal system protein YbgF